MSSYIQLQYHLVFATKKRIPCLTKSQRHLLFKYIHGYLINKKCHLYAINGVEDHIHILTHIHQSIAVSNLVKDMKVASNLFIKEQKMFNGFIGWQDGYGAFSHHANEIQRLTKYIRNQETHHQKVTWRQEMISLLEEHGIEFDEMYLQ